MTTPLWAIGLVVIASVFGSAGTLFLKLGANNIKKSIRSVVLNKDLIFGVLLYGLSAIFFLAGLKYGELSIIYPMSSLSYVFGALFSVQFLKEKMNSWKYAGMALILLGAFFIGLGA